MKKALHTFTLTEERSSWETTSYTEPYVSSVFRVDKPVHYNRVDGYIRFTSLQANANVKMIGNGTPNVEYSRNYYDWEDWDFSTVTLANEGDKVWFRGVNPSGFNHDVSTTGDCRNFVSTGKTSLDGNIMTLLYGQKALGDYSLEIKENESGGCFANLFSGNTGLTGEIKLPSPTAPNRCYYGLLRDCTLWDYAPALPASENLGVYCYFTTLSNTAIEEAPELPAMKIPEGGYDAMFYYCKKLKKAPYLPATEIGIRAYRAMFQGCSAMTETQDVLPIENVPASGCDSMYQATAIEKAPEMEMKTVGRVGCRSMFQNSKQLKNAPTVLFPVDVSASLVIGSGRWGPYASMFRNCSALQTVPLLCGTTFGEASYQNMFDGCSSIKETPALPDTVKLPTYAWLDMFVNCKSLVKVTSLPTLITSYGGHAMTRMFSGCTSLKEIYYPNKTRVPSFTNWVAGVPSGGTFYVDPDKTWTETYGANAIPEGWTVQYYEP